MEATFIERPAPTGEGQTGDTMKINVPDGFVPREW